MSFIRDFTDTFAGNRAKRAIRKIALVIVGAILGLALLIGAVIVATSIMAWRDLAHARDDGQWTSSPGNIRQWFQSLMQPDNTTASCCGEADAFEADQFEMDGDHYVAVITDGKGILPIGTRIPVPNHKMKWDAGNPTGHGVIFIGPRREVYCYVAPGGV